MAVLLYPFYSIKGLLHFKRLGLKDVEKILEPMMSMKWGKTAKKYRSELWLDNLPSIEKIIQTLTGNFEVRYWERNRGFIDFFTQNRTYTRLPCALILKPLDFLLIRLGIFKGKSIGFVLKKKI